MNNILHEFLIPVLLGGTKDAFLISNVFSEKYRVISYVFGNKFYWRFILNPNAYIRKVKSESDELLCMILSSFAEKHSDSLLWLVPCSDEYAAFVQRNTDFLETMYVIRTERSIMPYEK